MAVPHECARARDRDIAPGRSAPGASFGVAVADCSEPSDGEELLRRADDPMYEAKGSRATLRIAA
jgi:GGDEF domain-containing protein